jgi:hypothetical protein
VEYFSEACAPGSVYPSRLQPNARRRKGFWACSLSAIPFPVTAPRNTSASRSRSRIAAAVAIQNARLYERAEIYAVELEVLIRQRATMAGT